MRKLLALGVVLVPMAAAPSFAQDAEKSFQGIKYACTGIAESKEDPRWAAYPLKLIFAAADGDYASDVRVEIDNDAGNRVFEAYCEFEPWLMVDLAPGKYKVTATAKNGQSKSVTLSVTGEKQAWRAFRFDKITES